MGSIDKISNNGLAKRIIPCLDVNNGRTVKGVNFKELRDAGDPVELACQYADSGADELVFLDITATHEKRRTLVELVKAVGTELDIPFTVGGGVSTLSDVEALLHSGADKITINSAAVRNPELITELANAFGSQCIVVAVDAKNDPDGWHVYLNGGRIRTERGLFEWADEICDRGAGEILFTSMDHDGTKDGFANKELAALSKLSIPIIASGGAGTIQHFIDTFNIGMSDAALAASVFHYGEIGIQELKTSLKEEGIHVR